MIEGKTSSGFEFSLNENVLDNMLDNLKLGYGGTKEEMQRLLADAQKISGVQYDMSNLSDVYSAIHVIQGELDITGTTAKEASSTISGSLAAMKSAFKNVLGQLTLGQDVRPALEGLAQTVTTFLFGNLIPAVWNIIRALPGALVTFVQTAVPQLVSAFMQFFPQIRVGITEGLPQLIQTGIDLGNEFLIGIGSNFSKIVQCGADILNSLIDGFCTLLPQVGVAVFDFVSSFLYSLIDELPNILEAGKSILLNIVEGIQQSCPNIIMAAGRLIASLLEGILTHFPDILASGFDLVISLIKGIGSALPDIIKAAGNVVESIWDVICNIDWKQLGKEIINGLINGIGSMASALWDAATNIAKSALDAIKSFFGIASPSKVMRDQVGKWIPAGIAVGIESNTKPISNAMQDLTRLTTGTLQTDLAVQLSRNAALTPALAVSGESGSSSISFYQTINTHDSLSPYEMTREAEDLMERIRWKNP